MKPIRSLPLSVSILALVLFVGCASPERNFDATPIHEQTLAPTVTLTVEPEPTAEALRVIEAFGKESYVHVAWSPDGSMLAVSGAATLGTPIKVYDTQTLDLVYELTRPGMNAARFTRFSPNGRWLMASEIAGNGFEAAIWDMTTGERVEQVTTHAMVWNAIWSPEGHRLAYWSAFREPEIQFWAAPDSDQAAPASLKLIGASELGDGVWLPDDTLAFAGLAAEGGLGLWRSDDPDHPLIISDTVVDYAPFISLSPDASLVASTDFRGLMRVWDARTGMLQYALQAKANTRLGDLAHQFSSDSNLLAAGVADEVVIWDMATGGIVARLTDHDSAVSFIAFSPDDLTLAVGESDGQVRLWYLPDYLMSPVTPTPIPTNTPVPTFEVSPLLVQTFKASVPPNQNGQTTGQVSDLHWLDSITLRVTTALFVDFDSFGRQVSDYDIRTGDLIETTETAGNPFGAFYSPNGEKYAVWTRGDDDTVAIFDTETSASLIVISPDQLEPGNIVSWAPDGKRIAVQTNDAIQVFDAASGKQLAELENVRTHPMGEGYQDVHWSPNGKWIASVLTGASIGSEVAIWDAETYALVNFLKEEADDPVTYEFGPVTQVAWAPDGHRLLTLRSERLELVDVVTNELMIAPALEKRIAVRGLASWSDDGRYVAVDAQIILGGPLVLLIWDTQANEMYIALERPVTVTDILPGSIRWAPNRSWIATADLSGTLTVIDARSGSAVQITMPFTVAPNAMAWSPDGKWLAVGEYSGQIAVWDFGQ